MNMQSVIDFHTIHEDKIASLNKNKEFMLNVEELAKLTVPKLHNKKLTKMYNKKIEELKGKIIMQAIAQSITNGNGIYVEQTAINIVQGELLAEKHNKQINNANKVGDIFRNSANSNKNELLEELGDLERQEKAKAEPASKKTHSLSCSADHKH